MDALCTDESDVFFTDPQQTGSASGSRSKSVEPESNDLESSRTKKRRAVSTDGRRKAAGKKPPSGVSALKPTNVDEQMDAFFASACTKPPQFKYAKSEQYIQEVFSQNDNVCFELLPEAERILKRVISEYGSSEAFMERLYGDEKVDVEKLHEKILSYLRDHNVDERVKVRIVDNKLAAASVSKAFFEGQYTYTVNIARIPFSSNMLQGTCDHEIGTHLLRMRNDEQQAWHMARERFRLGNPWITEEGFATLNTYQSMPCKLLFPQALRYYAVCRGAELGFVELYHELQGYVNNPKLNWQMCCRIKRGLFDTSVPGAFNMDQAYFKGAVEILRHLDEIDFGQLYCGQLSLQDVDKVKFVLRKDVVVLPWFLNCPAALKKYKLHCQQLIRENQIESATMPLVKPTVFRVARNFFKKVPKWTRLTPAYTYRASKQIDSGTSDGASDSTTIDDQSLPSEPSSESHDEVDRTEHEPKPEPTTLSQPSQDVLELGSYRIISDSTRVGPMAQLGYAALTHLARGTIVNVLEVVQVEDRLRGRIEHPSGWISLLNTADGFRWVKPTKKAPSRATVLSEPSIEQNSQIDQQPCSETIPPSEQQQVTQHEFQDQCEEKRHKQPQHDADQDAVTCIDTTRKLQHEYPRYKRKRTRQKARETRVDDELPGTLQKAALTCSHEQESLDSMQNLEETLAESIPVVHQQPSTDKTLGRLFCAYEKAALTCSHEQESADSMQNVEETLAESIPVVHQQPSTDSRASCASDVQQLQRDIQETISSIIEEASHEAHADADTVPPSCVPSANEPDVEESIEGRASVQEELASVLLEWKALKAEFDAMLPEFDSMVSGDILKSADPPAKPGVRYKRRKSSRIKQGAAPILDEDDKVTVPFDDLSGTLKKTSRRKKVRKVSCTEAIDLDAII